MGAQKRVRAFTWVGPGEPSAPNLPYAIRRKTGVAPYDRQRQSDAHVIADENPTDADLNDDEWVKAFNAQEQIHQIITEAAADERVVCRREKPTGSNRKQSICHSVAQWRSMQTDQAEMVRMSREGSTGARTTSGAQ